jgi:uncharacterized DUF497 family protein
LRRSFAVVGRDLPDEAIHEIHHDPVALGVVNLRESYAFFRMGKNPHLSISSSMINLRGIARNESASTFVTHRTAFIKMPKFDWDERKDHLNQQKHGIDFERAKEVFEDEDALTYPGKVKDGEFRFLIVGKVLGKFIVAVVFTVRAAVYRIISARQARNNEIKDYLINKFDKDDN